MGKLHKVHNAHGYILNPCEKVKDKLVVKFSSHAFPWLSKIPKITEDTQKLDQNIHLLSPFDFNPTS